jgi:hypothetical protein
MQMNNILHFTIGAIFLVYGLLSLKNILKHKNEKSYPTVYLSAKGSSLASIVLGVLIILNVFFDWFKWGF